MITGSKLFWDLSDIKYNLIDGETLIIEFDAKVEGGMCDECENLANVTANECSGRIFQWGDSARVYVECDFTAKAGGPYFGDIDEEIVIVIREKVDLTARGPNDVLVKNIGKDVGGDDYVDKKPYRPKSLPPGFTELYKG